MTGPLRLLVVCQVEVFGPPEEAICQAAGPLAALGWELTVTTPAPASQRGRRPDGVPASLAWEPLELGGLSHGAGARAVGSWPRARRLAAGHDAIYLNGSVAGRLLPALRSRPCVLHVHDIVRRVPRHWLHAEIVLADSPSSGLLLDPLDVRVVGSPVPLDPLRSGADARLVPVSDHARAIDDAARDAIARCAGRSRRAPTRAGG